MFRTTGRDFDMDYPRWFGMRLLPRRRGDAPGTIHLSESDRPDSQPFCGTSGRNMYTLHGGLRYDEQHICRRCRAAMWKHIPGIVTTLNGGK